MNGPLSRHQPPVARLTGRSPCPDCGRPLMQGAHTNCRITAGSPTDEPGPPRETALEDVVAEVETPT